MEFSLEKSRETGINFATFNQTATHFAIATNVGFTVYSISPKVEKFYEDIGGHGRSIVEMYEDTALIGLIGTGEDFSTSQRKVCLFNMHSEEVICSFSYLTAVIALKFSQDRFVFVMENEIHIHNSERLSEKPYKLETPNNPRGVCALSGQLLAYPCPHPDKREKGTVAIFDCKNQENYCRSITGHTEPIAAIAINSTGDLLATVSTRGTTIRVFKIPEGREEFAFRRGSYPAEVTSISFSQNSALLCVCSEKPTVHIFSLVKPNPKDESYFAGYIPAVLSSVWDDHPRIRLSDPTKSIAVISSNNKEVFVITQDGNFYVYDLDIVRGGNTDTPTIRENLKSPEFFSNSIMDHL